MGRRFYRGDWRDLLFIRSPPHAASNFNLKQSGQTKVKIKVAQFGLGPIGIETLKLAATKPWLEIVGGVDIDPNKIGKSLGELTGIKSLSKAKVYSSFAELLKKWKPDCVL